MKDSCEPLMVTVRCLTYNHAPYIHRSLDGFVMQKTDFRFEVIVHDDASTDGTADIIREYATKYPDIIKPILEKENQYSKHDGSLLRIMNEHTHGKYVAMCEGDDYWIDPLKLQKQVDFLEQNSEYGLIFTNVDVFYQKTGFWRRRYLTSKGLVPRCFEEHLINAGYIAPLTWMYRTEFLRTKPYHYVDGTFPLALDIWAKSKVYFLDEVTAVYRFLPESASHSRNMKKQYKFIKGVFKIQCDYSQKYSVSDDLILKIRRRYIENTFPYIVLNEPKEIWMEARGKLQQMSPLSVKNRIALFMSYTSMGIGMLKMLYWFRRR